MFKNNALLIIMCMSNLFVTIAHTRANNSVPMFWTICDVVAVLCLALMAFRNSKE